MDVYLLKNGQQVGPYSLEEIQTRIQSGKLFPEDMARKEGLEEWVSLSSIMPPLPPPLPQKMLAHTSGEKSGEENNWGKIIIGTFVVIFGGNYLIGQACSPSERPSGITGGTNPPAHQKIPKVVEAKVELAEFSVGWVKTTKGLISADGLFWAPQIRTTVKNNGSVDLKNYILRAVFIDTKGVITSDEKEWIRDLPAGYAKGPFFLKGSVGYTSDSPFVEMVADESKRWRFDLFYSTSYDGPWKKIKSDYVPVPDEYLKMFKE